MNERTAGTTLGAESSECIFLVCLEMGLSFFGIVANLLIVSTMRDPTNEETLKGSTINYLLFNLCFSNLVISFLVKPISAIYVGYAVSTGEAQVGLAFCTLYNFTYRTTWCVFPFTLIAMCWSKLLSQCRCSRCGVLCCKKKAFANLTKFQTVDSPMPVLVEPAPQPVTELLQFRANRERLMTAGSLQRESSVSTPTPSTTPEFNLFNAMAYNETAGPNGSQLEEMVPVVSRAPVRTLSDGPTTQQKVLVVSIWIFAAIFGFLTCFPDKFDGSSGSGGGSSGSINHRLKGPHDVSDAASVLTGDDEVEGGEKKIVAQSVPELSYCSVKNGVNDMLDYIALVVALVAPLIIGPCIVGVFQGVFAIFGRFVCSRGTNGGGGQEYFQREDKGPGWLIIVAFTLVFLGTYPLHMYIAEIYLHNDFTFLLAKYFVGFLYVILIPLITLIAQKEIRGGVATIIFRSNTNNENSGSCELLDEIPAND